MLTGHKPTSQSSPVDEVAISLENVSVLYRVPRERVSGIKEYTIRLLQRRLEYEEFLALDKVSFQVKRGETFGVIGRNGSGKSTLLKVIARVLFPSQGRVVTRGKVAPLLELGAGFQMELTGRENIHLYSALLGRSLKETDALLPSIIDFAEIGEFIEAPLRTYSTGMVARLGFAVATSVRPDILLIDEILSVGDGKFQQKCLDRMYAYQEQGTTIIFVSHSLAVVEDFCERALWLEQGDIKAIGKSADVITTYVRADRPEPEIKPPVISVPETFVPIEPIKIEPDPGQEYVHLTEIGGVYSAEDIFKTEQGSVSVLLRRDIGQPLQDAVIFHSDDSRYVLHVSIEISGRRKRGAPKIVARAGGNRRVIDTYYGVVVFPEASEYIDIEAPPQEGETPESHWHLVVMTWVGYPDGKVSLYMDGKFVKEHFYDHRYDNGSPLLNNIAVGMRPSTWTGELIQNEDGTVIESRPTTTMSVNESGIEIKDVRLYQRVLQADEIEKLFEGYGLSEPQND